MMEDMNSDDDKILKMWTVQTGRVLDTLAEDGVYFVKERYIKEKYGSTAWIFQQAYRFFSKRAQTLVDRPEEAESPVWMFYDKRWAVPGEGAYQIELRIPKTELVTFDLRLWSKVLNLSYMGTEKQEEAFEQKLRQMGICDTIDVFEKPYYPLLKSEIIKSWEYLFIAGCQDRQYMQGAAWMLRKEWILLP